MAIGKECVWRGHPIYIWLNMAIRRKNIYNPRRYLTKYFRRKLPNPIAKSLGQGAYKQRVVRSGKIYDRKKEKKYED